MSEYVKVPKSDIARIEEARLFIYEYFAKELENNIRLSCVLHEITNPMWRLTHKRYDEVI